MEKPILASLLSVKTLKLSDFEKCLFEKYNPLGVTLFARNIYSFEQLVALINSIKEVIGRDDVIIAIDEEGGRVQRLKFAGFDEYASQNILGQVDNVDITKLHAMQISQDMKSVGANLNFAPVLDIDYPDINIALKNRCLSDNKEKIVKHGKIISDTYINEGICPCIKHIPGQGRIIDDPHKQLPVINCSIKELEDDFYPFKRLKNLPAAMTAHILLSQVDNDNPITTSSKCINEIIRTIIGFNGFLISDAIDMHALKGTIAQKANAAWQAGCDAVCYCLADEKEMQSLCENGKYLDEKSLTRFDVIKNIICHNKETIVLDKQKELYYSAINVYTEEFVNYDAISVLHQLKKGEK